MVKLTSVKKVSKPNMADGGLPDDGGLIPYNLQDQLGWLKVIKNRKLTWEYIPGLYTEAELEIMFNSLKHQWELKRKDTRSKNSFGEPLYRIAKKI